MPEILLQYPPSGIVHSLIFLALITKYRFLVERGAVAQLIRALPCHGRGRGFESRRSRKTKKSGYTGYFFF